MEKNTLDKLKENLPDIKHFARRHISESLTVLALILGGLSAWKGFFFGGIGTALAFLVIGTALGIFLPEHIDGLLKKFYQLAQKRDRTSEIIVGASTVVIAVLFPFIFFGMIGLLAGTSYHYFSRQAQSSKK